MATGLAIGLAALAFVFSVLAIIAVFVIDVDTVLKDAKEVGLAGGSYAAIAGGSGIAGLALK